MGQRFLDAQATPQPPPALQDSAAQGTALLRQTGSPSPQSLEEVTAERGPAHIHLHQASLHSMPDAALVPSNRVGIGQLWWRRLHPTTVVNLATAERNAALLAGLQLTMMGKEVLALLDTGATHSFVSPRLVDELQLRTIPTQDVIEMVVASGGTITVKGKPPGVKFKVGKFYTMAEMLVAPVPYSVILGADWLHRRRAIWDFGKGKLTVFHGEWRFNIPVLEVTTEDLCSRLATAEMDEERQQACAAHAQLLDTVNRLGPQAAALVRKQQKRYKNFRTKNKRVPVKEILASLQGTIENLLPEGPQCLLLAAAPTNGQPTADIVAPTATARAYDSKTAFCSLSQPSYSKIEEC